MDLEQRISRMDGYPIDEQYDLIEELINRSRIKPEPLGEEYPDPDSDEEREVTDDNFEDYVFGDASVCVLF